MTETSMAIRAVPTYEQSIKKQAEQSELVINKRSGSARKEESVIDTGLATRVAAPNGFCGYGKHWYKMKETLFQVDDKYIPIKLIGQGAYGVVCSSLNNDTKERVAIKKICNVFQNRVYAVRTLREVMLLRRIKHSNVIGLKDIMMPTKLSKINDVYLVYELMDTDLDRVIHSTLPLNNDHCKSLLFQLLRGLKHLHSANVLHRDLKPGNLLVNANGELKIGDFGLARTSRDEGQLSMTEYVVTRWYRAPELLLGCNSYGKAVDMWSAGCILAEILGRQPLFRGNDPFNQLELILVVLGRQNEDDLEFIGNAKVKGFIQSLNPYDGIPFSTLFPKADPLALDLLSKILVFNPSKRITAKEALCHPYISELSDPSDSPELAESSRIDNIDIDDESIGEPALRQLLLREIFCYHP